MSRTTGGRGSVGALMAIALLVGCAPGTREAPDGQAVDAWDAGKDLQAAGGDVLGEAGHRADPGTVPGDFLDSGGTAEDPGIQDPGPAEDRGASGGDAAASSLALVSVEPAEGPTDAATTVTLRGVGFREGMEVFFGPRKGWDLFVFSDRIANVTVPPGAPGTVDVRVTREDGASVVLAEGFRYRGTLGIVGLDPDSGPGEGGTPVVIRGTGLSEPVDVLFGGRRVPEQQPVDDRTLLVVTPPGEPGPATVTVLRGTERARLVDGFQYRERETFPGHPSFQVLAADPDHGPWEGGTVVLVRGTGFRPGAAVRIGALPARSVEVLGEDRIRAIVAPGSPGPADVVVRQGYAAAVLPDGYRYDWPGGPVLWDADPDSGSWAGGTRVRIQGANLEGTTRVFFGNAEASGLRVVHSGLLEVRAPRAAESGPVPLMVLGKGGGALGPASFLYFDPRLAGGGVWGGPIRGDLNVTVLNGANGARLPGALALLGAEGRGVGVTDDRGQVTLSSPDLRGPQVLTVAKAGFSAATYAGFDGRNATLYVSPVGSPESGDPPPATGGSGSDCVVEGRIRDYGKYLVKPSWLTTTPFVRCEVSGTSQYGGGPDPGPGGTPDARGHFSVIGRSGTFALWCRLLAPDPVAGGVLTLRDGLVRRLSCGPSGRVEGVVVTLDRETDGEFVLATGALPEAPYGSNPPYVIASYELGEDGWLPMLNVQQRQGDRIRFPWQPRSFEGDFGGLGYAFYVTTSAAPAPGTGSNGMPYSVALARRVAPFAPPSPDAGGLALVEDTGGGVAVVAAPLAEITAMAPLPDGRAIAVDASGGTWEFDGVAFQAGPLRVDRPLLGVHAASDGDLWFVGARGTVRRLRTDGVRDLQVPLAVDLVAVAGESGDRVSVGGGSSLWSWDGAAWVGEPLPASVRGIRALRRFPGGEILGVGDGGIVFRGVSGRGLGVDQPVTETLRGLNCLDRETCLAVGDGGILLRIAPEDVTILRAPGNPDLAGAVMVGPDRAWLFGAAGRVLQWDGRSFTEVVVPRRDLDLRAGVTTAGRVLLAGRRFLPLPGFLGYPWIQEPVAQAPWTARRLAWSPLSAGTGGGASYLQALISNASGWTVWSVIADGELAEVGLPDLESWLGEPVLPAGSLRVNLTAVRAPGFRMGAFGSQDLAWDRREAFSVNLVGFLR
ncbi:MAG TPA: IPT/TIG domain-containing protein [Myxococcota bacterium]|nr:IPT/TIG domain-containing protein [Myxococcota bacterium]HQK51503.1 IPT/TIG domain-containing protein [Myxococcota bacterium]